jgi:hypothetical protein
LEIVLTLTQDWGMVCTIHTIGLEIILDTPDEILCDVGLVESHFGSFGDNVTVGTR